MALKFQKLTRTNIRKIQSGEKLLLTIKNDEPTKEVFLEIC